VLTSGSEEVRKSRVRAALSWLQRNNPLYKHVIINYNEIDCWQYAEGSSVPALIMETMQREEPSAVEKTQTDHIVPDTDRGLEENRFTSIEELVTSIQAYSGDYPCLSTEQPEPALEPEPTAGNGGDTVYEMSTSGMFPLDGPAAFAEADKLSFLVGNIQTSQGRGGDDPKPCAMQVQTTEEEPYIRVERGADFADSLHEDFFPRTFPKLFPWGRGGPKARSEPDCHLHHLPEAVRRQTNHSLNYWARYVLQRHGGRFATHPIFCFLVFNILLRSSNRRISMVRMTKGSFARVEQIYGNLTADRLKRAEAEMRETRTTTDADISFLLRELKLDVARLRLTRWGQAVGLGPILDKATSLQSTTLAVENISVAERVLGQILALFKDAQDSKRFPQDASIGESLDSADGSDRALTSLHQKMRALAIRRQGKAGLREKTKWALHRGKHFSRLIEVIRDLITDLEGLLPAVDVQRLCEVDISELDQAELPLLQEISATEDNLLSETIKDVYRAIQESTQKQEERQQDNQTKKCLSDLLLTDPRDDIQRIADTKGGLFEGASNWILGHADFRRWRHTDEARLLWIKGDPGKGKTMLLIAIVRELDRDFECPPRVASTTLSYFFCQGTDENLNNAAAVLRGLIYLLCIQQPLLASHLRARYDHAGAKLFQDANSFFALSKVLEGMLHDERLQRAYLLIDALDECMADRERLLRFIASYTTSPRVKWIVSSRNIPEIERLLEVDGSGSEVKLSLEVTQNAEQVAHAVDMFIDHKLSKLRSLRNEHDMRGRLREIIRQKANGTFLWVALVVEELGTAESWDMLEVLENSQRSWMIFTTA